VATELTVRWSGHLPSAVQDGTVRWSGPRSLLLLLFILTLEEFLLIGGEMNEAIQDDDLVVDGVTVVSDPIRFPPTTRAARLSPSGSLQRTGLIGFKETS